MSDNVGKKFNMLKAVSISHRGSNRQWHYLFRCDCGNEKVLRYSAVSSGNTKSCGCFLVENAKSKFTKHGLSKSKIYNTWENIIKRCTNKNSPDYSRYGERGISVCVEWLDFNVFLRDVGIPSSKSLTLERIDNDKGYSRENCKWATRRDQARNTRRTVRIEYEANEYSLPEFCEIFSLDYKKALYFHKRGCSPADLILKSVAKST
jgi:hypothetical protein